MCVDVNIYCADKKARGKKSMCEIVNELFLNFNKNCLTDR